MNKSWESSKLLIFLKWASVVGCFVACFLYISDLCSKREAMGVLGISSMVRAIIGLIEKRKPNNADSDPTILNLRNYANRP